MVIVVPFFLQVLTANHIARKLAGPSAIARAKKLRKKLPAMLPMLMERL